MMLEIDAITKMLAAVSTGRDTRPRSRLKATSRPVRAHPNRQCRDDHGDADGDGLVQRFEYQVVREAAADESREHAERQTVELDVVLDSGNRQRTEQQQGEDDDGRCVIHAIARTTITLGPVVANLSLSEERFRSALRSQSAMEDMT